MRAAGVLGAMPMCMLLLAVSSAADDKVKIEGYAEYRKGDVLIVDGQRVTAGGGMRVKGKGPSFDDVPLGYEVKVKGIRQADGSVAALELEAKPNNDAMFEGDAVSATSELEDAFLQLGRLPKEMGGHKLRTEGRDVERTRRIAERLLPPYKTLGDFRIYVARDAEWNAFACANGMIVVNQGLLEDMDDDEVALIVGHEIAHATHEHTRRSMKKALWGALLAAGVQGAAEAIEDEELRALAQGAAALGSLAWNAGFSRGMEDQADRVGMRYAYEAGFDVSKAPGLWRKFAEEYGDSDKVVNFFFGDHSLSRQRAVNAEQQLAFNFAEDEPIRTAAAGDDDDDDEPVRVADNRGRAPARRPAPRRKRTDEGTGAGTAVTGTIAKDAGLLLPEDEPSESDMEWVDALVAKSGGFGDGGTVAKSMDAPTVTPGMSSDQVKAALGAPRVAVEDTWIYAKVTVKFENGKVKAVNPVKDVKRR